MSMKWAQIFVTCNGSQISRFRPNAKWKPKPRNNNKQTNQRRREKKNSVHSASDTPSTSTKASAGQWPLNIVHVRYKGYDFLEISVMHACVYMEGKQNSQTPNEMNF